METPNNLAVVADVEFDVEIQAGDNSEVIKSRCFGRELGSHIPFLTHHLWLDLFSLGETDIWFHVSVTPIKDKRTTLTKLAE